MKWTVSKEFHFDAAHSLPHLPETHKCSRLHGHTYKIVVHCSGDLLVPKMGWVVDYAEIAAAVSPIINSWDHRNLNEVLGVMTTTAEKLAFILYEHLKDKLPVSAIDVHETTGTRCRFEP